MQRTVCQPGATRTRDGELKLMTALADFTLFRDISNPRRRLILRRVGLRRAISMSAGPDSCILRFDVLKETSAVSLVPNLVEISLISSVFFCSLYFCERLFSVEVSRGLAALLCQIEEEVVLANQQASCSCTAGSLLSRTLC